MSEKEKLNENLGPKNDNKGLEIKENTYSNKDLEKAVNKIEKADKGYKPIQDVASPPPTDLDNDGVPSTKK